jgi:4-carboxymuconolactone decarboxylase
MRTRAGAFPVEKAMKTTGTLHAVSKPFNWPRIRGVAFTLIVVFFANTPGVSMAQVPSSSRIDPVSLSRLPGLLRDDLKPEDRALFDRIAGVGRSTPLLGPGGVSLYMPRVADGMDLINQYLRFDSVLGRRYIEVAILVAAREFDQQYEWAAHEPAALQEGAPQDVVDVIKYHRDSAALPVKDKVIIDYGRQILREHRLDQALWDTAVTEFGQQGALEIAAIIGDYLMAAVLLHAVDQQIPPERTARMPVE